MFGFLNIDKPLHITSHDVVARVRRLLRERGLKHVKVGHAGTLDPLATGVLVVCLGTATRLSEYVMGHDKTYRAQIKLGVETETYDAEGAVTATVDASHVTATAIEAALAGFVGDIAQMPPMYSAIKQGGKKLYDLARAGQVVERQARPVTIHAVIVEGIDFDSPSAPVVTCEIRCSAGTYIRSIAHDLGEALAVGGHLVGLERTASGSFSVAEAVSLEQLADTPDWAALLVSPIDALAGQPTLSLDEAAWDELSHGRTIPSAAGDGEMAYALLDGRLCAVVRAESGQWLPHKVFLPETADS